MDVSEIVVMGGRSGIQRVVRRIVQEGAVDPSLDRQVEPVVSMGNGLHRLNERGRLALLRAEAADRRDGSTPLILERDGALVRAAKRMIRLLPRLREGLRNRAIERSFRSLTEERPVRLGDDDRYVVLDSFWTRSSAPSTAARLRRQGDKVVALVHDALMLTHADAVTPDVATRFADRLRRMTDAGVPLISISRSSSSEIKRVITAAHDMEVGYFYHGHDLPSPDRPSAVAWPERLWNDDAATFLVVGTFEPRKNQKMPLRAFERLWASGYDGKLLMIGQIGVGSEEFVDELARHPQLGKSLFVIHNADDAMILDAYRRSTALIMPSLAEGFGLPVVEALGLGLPVIASDIAVFHEIGGDACRFFDRRSIDALAEAVRDVASHLPEWRKRAAAFTWIDWRQATRGFIAAVEAAVRQPATARPDA